MATWHLEEIEKRIHQISWSIVNRIDGEDYRISGSWIIRRKTERKLDFEGMGDLDVKPIHQAYACKIKETGIALYFYRKGKQWDDALAEFINQLNELD